MRILFEYPTRLLHIFSSFHSLKVRKNREKDEENALFIGVVRRFIISFLVFPFKIR